MAETRHWAVRRRSAEPPVEPGPTSDTGVSPLWALTMALAALGFAAAGISIFTGTRAPGLGGFEVVRLELAGDAAEIARVAGQPDAHLKALATDLWLVVGYVGAIVVAGLLGRRALVTSASRRGATAVIAAGVLAGALAIAANSILYAALTRWIDGYDTMVGQVVQALTFVALVLLAYAGPAATAIVATVLFRLTLFYALRRRPAIADDDVFCYEAPAQPVSTWAQQAQWHRNWALPPGREVGGTGICVSGGGVRSATFSMGALQVLQEQGELGRARYVVGVSGGGYAVGAMRLALAPSPHGGPESVAEPGDVFANGSVEFDHLRRHGKYLADGTAQWLKALAVVLRGVVVAQVTLVLVMVLVGLGLGKIYALIPAIDQSLRTPWHPAAGIGWAMGGPYLVALVCWLLSVVIENVTMLSPIGRALANAGRGLFYLGLATVLVGLVVPTVVYLSGLAIDLVPHSGDKATSNATAATTVLTTGYLATIVAIFTVVRRVATSVTGWFGRNKARLTALPALVLQRLVVIVGVLVLTLANLFVFARVVAETSRAATAHVELPGILRDWRLAALVATLVILTVLADQTRWSLHPFYKKRLMSAFAVRRVKDADTGVRAEPFDYDLEVTDLDRYGTRVAGFPQVIFVTAANVSGQSLTPPGRRALPYSMSGDWVGTPRLGWVRSDRLRAIASEPIRADLTVQGAMALSGAAFASAMGAAGTAYSLLFALTNARLGSWLPNPRYLHGQRRSLPGRKRWSEPRLPRWRRVPYLIREIFGRYRPDGRMLLLTDGGHYDNLGLIELLRHAPEVAYCFDASGGANIAASALGPAITMAWQELGIRITFRDQPAPPSGTTTTPTVPGDWADDVLAQAGVLVCDVTYPDCRPDGAPRTGTLYFGRAVITVDSPWSVQAYHRRNPSFPNDSTSDQWFGQEQFDAYHALGRHIGGRVLAAGRVGVQSALTD